MGRARGDESRAAGARNIGVSGATHGSLLEDEATQERWRWGRWTEAPSDRSYGLRHKRNTLPFGETRHAHAARRKTPGRLSPQALSYERGSSASLMGPGESLLPLLGPPRSRPPGSPGCPLASACSLRCWESPLKQAPGPKGRPVVKLTKSRPEASRLPGWKEAPGNKPHTNISPSAHTAPSAPRPHAPSGQQMRMDMTRYLLTRSVQSARGQGAGNGRSENRTT